MCLTYDCTCIDGVVHVTRSHGTIPDRAIVSVLMTGAGPPHSIAISFRPTCMCSIGIEVIIG